LKIYEKIFSEGGKRVLLDKNGGGKGTF